MTDREEFERIRAEVCASGPASDGDNLLGMEIDCCAFLGDPAYAEDDPGLWTGMEIRRTGRSDWLIRGRASGARGNAAAIAAELSNIWQQRLGYGYLSAHSVTTSIDSVELRAVTQVAPSAFWVTVDVQITLA